MVGCEREDVSGLVPGKFQPTHTFFVRLSALEPRARRRLCRSPPPPPFRPPLLSSSTLKRLLEEINYPCSTIELDSSGERGTRLRWGRKNITQIKGVDYVTHYSGLPSPYETSLLYLGGPGTVSCLSRADLQELLSQVRGLKVGTAQVERTVPNTIRLSVSCLGPSFGVPQNHVLFGGNSVQTKKKIRD